jgi:RND family efflux transporter MFP subunit
MEGGRMRSKAARAARPESIALTGIGVLVLVLGGGFGLLFLARRLTVARAFVTPATPGLVASSAAPPPIHHPVDFVGVLLPPLTVNVAPRLDGKIASIDVELGSVRHAGDVLASLDARLEKHELEMAKASFRAAVAVSAAARVEVERTRDHAERRRETSVVVDNETLSLVSGEEAAQAKFDEHSAAAKLVSSVATTAQEQRHVDQVSTLLDEHVLRAPFDCAVTGRYGDPGAYVKAGDPIVRIIATGGMLVRFAVPEDAIGSVKVKDRVRIALDTTALDGQVERISPEVEPASRTVFVEAQVEGAASVCQQGCLGRAGHVVRVSLRSP